MAFIKLTVTLVILWLLQKGDFLWYPLVAPFVQMVASISIAWCLARRITRDFLCKKILPRTSADRKAVLITGCDTGIGHALALKLNKDGFFVFAGCLNAASNGASDLKKKAMQPDRMICLQMDVTSDKEISAALELVSQVISDKQFDVDKLYAVVNNAGLAVPCFAEAGGTGAQDVYMNHLQVNTMGAIRVTRTFLPLLRQAKPSRVINISSAAARSNLAGLSPYGLSKAAVSKFTEALQDEVTRFGVRTIGVEPFFYKTDLTDAKYLRAGLEKSFSESNDAVKSAYQDQMKEVIRWVESIMTSPWIVSEDTETLIDAIADALTSAEPDLVVRVIPPHVAFVFWLLHDIFPWEVLSCLKMALDKSLSYLARRQKID